MRVLSKETDYGSNIERYDLNGTFSEKDDNKGLIVCYLLAVCKSFKLILAEFKAKHEEIGVPKEWYSKYRDDSFEKTFDSLEAFLEAYDDNDFGEWEINAVYRNAQIIIVGEREHSEIGIIYPEDRKLNFLPLLSEIETATYRYNNCDKQVLSILMDEYEMTEKNAVITVKGLQAHPDIYEEFVIAITTGKYADDSVAVRVEGFTAKALNTNYPLSPLGAYNYLVYLREAPKDALEDLKKGLPRK